MSNFKPCPFCGETVNWCECEAGCASIFCLTCNLTFEIGGPFEMTLEEHKERMVNAWNKRVERKSNATK